MAKIDEGMSMSKPFALVLLFLGLDFLKSSYGKFTSGGKFIEGMGGTLKGFAAKNPNPVVKSFLEGSMSNATMLGTLVMWGELLVALSLVVGSLLVLFAPTMRRKGLILVTLGALGGAFLNVTFYFAAGWTSPSTESLNLIMAAIEILTVFVGARALMD